MINNKYTPFEWISGLEIENINVEENEENLDIVDNIREKNEALINIRLDVVNQAIITDDNLDISYFDEDMISNIHQNTEDISLQIIEETYYTMFVDIHDDIDDPLTRLDKILDDYIYNWEEYYNIDENDEKIEYT